MFARAVSTFRAALPAGAAAAAYAYAVHAPVQAAASMFELSEADNMAGDERHFSKDKVYSFTKDFVEKDFEDAATAKGVDSTKKQELLNEALKHIKSANQYDGSNSDARRWFGTILQAHSGFQGFKQQIADAFEVEAQWKAAIAINPDDATAHHLLGRWCFTVANMAWYQRSIASTLFAEPPSSTFEEARDYFAGAERIAPDFWKMNQFKLAECELQLGNTAEGVRWLQKALALPVRTQEDKEVQGKALALLQSWDAAAGAVAAKAEKRRLELAAQLEE